MSDTTKDPLDSIFQKLSEKFRIQHIEWVIVNAYDYMTSNGKHVVKAYATPYIKKESAEQRLDQTLGPFNWENDFELVRDDKVKFTLRIRENEQSQWIQKTEGATLDTRERGQFTLTALESALAFAEKRVLNKVGIGRYLKLVEQTSVDVSNTWSPGANKYGFGSKVKKGSNGKPEYIKFYWKEPALPAGALHEKDKHLALENTTSDEETREAKPDESQIPATKQMKDDIEAYFMNLQSKEEADTWMPYLYKEIVDDETGEVSIVARNHSMANAKKILKKFSQKYGKLVNNVPEKLANKESTKKK